MPNYLDVFGISTDNVQSLSDFHKKHQLNFLLLADPKMSIVSAYNTKMPVVNYSKRWTFIINPDLVIEFINQDVDAASDGESVVKKIIELQLKVGKNKSK
ncbi:MAG: redoxin domain-containing protein [Oligoflexia bacterium]|nr:redoxin domain-containing protein [Oligoflexia bacterium]